jgi:DNA replication protein DnaC
VIEEAKRNQKKVQAWVPMSLWDKVVALGYKNTTDAVTKGLEKLLMNSNMDPNESN